MKEQSTIGRGQVADMFVSTSWNDYGMQWGHLWEGIRRCDGEVAEGIGEDAGPLWGSKRWERGRESWRLICRVLLTYRGRG